VPGPGGEAQGSISIDPKVATGGRFGWKREVR